METRHSVCHGDVDAMPIEKAKSPSLLPRPIVSGLDLSELLSQSHNSIGHHGPSHLFARTLSRTRAKVKILIL